MKIYKCVTDFAAGFDNGNYYYLTDVEAAVMGRKFELVWSEDEMKIAFERIEYRVRMKHIERVQSIQQFCYDQLANRKPIAKIGQFMWNKDDPTMNIVQVLEDVFHPNQKVKCMLLRSDGSSSVIPDGFLGTKVDLASADEISKRLVLGRRDKVLFKAGTVISGEGNLCYLLEDVTHAGQRIEGVLLRGNGLIYHSKGIHIHKEDEEAVFSEYVYMFQKMIYNGLGKYIKG